MSDIVVKCEGVNWKLDFPVITSKTNSGKTTLAVKSLRGIIEIEAGKSFDKVILLTPYTRTRKQILSDERFKGLVCEFDATTFDNALSKREEKIIVATYAALCLALKDGMITLDGCLVIFDELHTFIEFTAYQSQMGYLLEWLVKPELWSRFYAVGLSGTPQILFDYINHIGKLPFEFKNITPNAPMNLTCGDGLVVKGGSSKSYADYLIQQGFEGAKLFYVDSAKICYDLACKFKNAGYSAAYIVSESHDEHKDDEGVILGDAMKEQVFEGLSILDWLDERSNTPPNLNVLVINAAAKDGINILDEPNRFDEVVIDSVNRATIEQARSRIRHDLDRLTIIYSWNYKSRSKLNLDDALGFLEEYKANPSLETLVKRLDEQRQDDTLNWIVAAGETAFVNPFIKPLCAYNLDNYEFSKVKTYYDDAGNEIEERRTISRFGKTLDTFGEWLAALKPMIGGKDFEVVSGEEIKSRTNNLKADRFDITPWLDRKLFTEDKRELAVALGLVDNKRRPKGWTTIKRYLESKGYIVESKGSKAINPHNGKNQTYSKLKNPKN